MNDRQQATVLVFCALLGCKNKTLRQLGFNLPTGATPDFYTIAREVADQLLKNPKPSTLDCPF